MNKVTLIGRLGQEPESTDVNGTTKTKFSLATSEQWKNKEGEKQEKTTWHNCVAWRKTAEIISQYLHKGDPVAIEGKIENRSWDDKDTGEKKYISEVVIDRFEFLPAKKDKENMGNTNNAEFVEAMAGTKLATPKPNANKPADDDLPF